MEYIIYKITNILNNKIYIGQTTETLKQRFKRHCGYQLNDGTYLHKAMKKYGIENFIIEEIERVQNQEELDLREYYWINYYESHIKGYNLKNSIGKCGGDTLSNNKNISTIKQKISESKKLDKNPNAKKIKAINLKTEEFFYYNSMKECQIALGIKRHDVISKRCRKIINKPYNNEWFFEYI